MRRKTLLMTLLMLIGFSMANATEVVVGSLETNKLTNQFPTNPYFAYSLSQQIYTAGELGGTAGSITSISFYRDWTSESIDQLKMSGLKLYMLMTTKTQFDSETDMVPVTDADLVWQGTLTAPAIDYKGWVTVNLDKPFSYDGVNNLLVCFYDDNPQKTVNNTNKFYYNATSANTALTYFGNDVAPDLANLSEYAGNKLAMSAHNYAKFQIGNYRRIEIIDNTTNGQFPAYTNYNYSLSQQIYTVDEVGPSKTLNSISFRNTGEEKTRIINLYLVQTDKTQFDATDDFINFTNANMVFSGEVTFGNTDWTTIEFDIPFAYSSAQNLAVVMADNSGHYEGSASFLAYGATDQSIMSYTDTEPVTLSNFTVYGSYLGAQKNKVRFNEGNPTGEKSNMSLPTFPAYKYSLSQQIYSHSDMDFSANSISSISFYNCSENEAIRYLDVYLKNTTKYQYIDGDDGETVTESDKVFSGYVTIKPSDWTAIRFDKYFEYNGSDHLLVVVNDRTGKHFSSNMSWLVMNCPSQSLNSYADGSDYDPGSVYSCTLLDEKNQVLFNDKGLSFKPTNVSAFDIVWNGATISWEGRGSKWNLRYKAEGTEEWTVIEDITENQYQLTGLEQETLYLIDVQGNDNGDLSDWSDRTSFKTSEQYPKPTDLEVMEVTPYSAIVRWTDNCSATAWEIEAYYSYGSETKFSVEAGSNPFVLTGLHPGVTYNIFVRSVIDAENGIYGNWSSYVTFTTPEANPAPNIMAVEPIPGGANISWEGESDRYIVRYRKPTPPPSVYYYKEDFESITTEGELPEGWTVVDADGDGFNWKSTLSPGYKFHSGTACLYSESYDNNTSSALTPDNWLITPQLELKGTLSAWLAGQDSSWPSEHFAIYVSTAGTDIADFVEVLPEEVATSDYVEYTVDLSAYEGQ